MSRDRIKKLLWWSLLVPVLLVVGMVAAEAVTPRPVAAAACEDNSCKYHTSGGRYCWDGDGSNCDATWKCVWFLCGPACEETPCIS